MNSAEFTSRYVLHDAMTTSGVMSYRAKQSGTQRPVLVHILEGRGTEGHARVWGALERLGGADRDVLIEMLDVDGTAVVVTPIFPGFQSLERWLEARGTPVERPVSLTNLFWQESGSQIPPVAAPAAAPTPAPPAPPTRPARPQSDFTRIINPGAPAPPQAVAAPAGLPAEFTRELAALESRLKAALRLAIIVNVVVGVVVVIVLYFMLSR